MHNAFFMYFLEFIFDGKSSSFFHYPVLKRERETLEIEFVYDIK